MYAVFQDGSKQHRVGEGDVVDVDYRPLKPGDIIEFDNVLLCSREDGVIVGNPTIPNAKVRARVVGKVQGPKLYIVRFRRRKNSKRRVGHRESYTRVGVEEIALP